MVSGEDQRLEVKKPGADDKSLSAAEEDEIILEKKINRMKGFTYLRFNNVFIRIQITDNSTYDFMSIFNRFRY